MEFLASDALNGRGSGTRDEWIAATYIASAFRRWGLEPMGDDGGYVQTVEMSRAEATAPPVLTAGSLRATHGKEMVVQTLGSPATISGLLQKFSPGTAVADGAILLMPEEATNADRAAASRAGLILSIESAQARASWDAASARVVAGPSRPIKFLASAAPVATRVFLDKATYAALQAMPAGAPVSFAAAIRSSQPSAFTWNAVAKMTGSDVTASREVIVLSAHLDHLGRPATAAGADAIFNGADDDASGTVAVMELAEALARGPRPKRTLVFALFGSEESGGAGAGYFVNLPVVPLAQIVADLQFEMLGRPDEKVAQHTLWLTGYSLSNLGPELARQGARLVDDPHPDQSFFTRSDNIRFARRGIIAHTVSSFNLHADYHRASDEVKTIDFAHMTDAIRSMLEPMRSLANSSFRPTWIAGGCPAPCR
jgi:aminopeptidase YwaD